jgi:hypothetical protein
MNMKKRIEKLNELADRKLGFNSFKLYVMKDNETPEEAIDRLGLADVRQDQFHLITETDVNI